jgi:hypothetical protein
MGQTKLIAGEMKTVTASTARRNSSSGVAAASVPYQ